MLPENRTKWLDETCVVLHDNRVFLSLSLSQLYLEVLPENRTKWLDETCVVLHANRVFLSLSLSAVPGGAAREQDQVVG